MKQWLPLLLGFLVSCAFSQCPSFSSQRCRFGFAGAECSFASCILLSQEPNSTEQTSSDWAFCLSSCCSSAEPSAPQFLGSLSRSCLGFENEDDNIIYAFSFGVGLTVFFIIFFYCLYACLDPAGWIGCEPGFASLLLPNSNSRPFNSISPSGHVSMANSAENLLKFVSTEVELLERKLARTCSICLEEGTTLKASCGHEYHSPCIREWYERKQECPECRQQNHRSLRSLLCKCQSQSRTSVSSVSSVDFKCGQCEV